MNRDHALHIAMTDPVTWDVLVIGGGATGLGSAVDAASRGYRTLLIEQADFAKATSSRSTKLVHGGVRYLQQGNISLVLEALKERGRMLHNAPHLVRRQSFVIPAYALWQIPFYGIGLKLYDALSGSSSFGRSRLLGASAVRSMLPSIDATRLAGGVEYFDGQFDDARYALALAQTLTSLGGAALNYTRMVRLIRTNGKLSGAVLRDEETGAEFEVQARAILNATGIFTDEVRQLDDPAAAPILSVSQGSHFVLPRDFLPGVNALMIPKTRDGRVLFAIPWHNHVVIGTTDDAVPRPALEPHAMQIERDFLREHIEFYFGRKLSDTDILSVWSGQRPLVRKQGASSTAALSREHTVLVSPSGLVSITGGKWTTYRRMAEDAIDIVAKHTALSPAPCRTADLHLHGWIEEPDDTSHALAPYGSDKPAIDALAAEFPALAAPLHPRLPYRLAEVVWAARYEMARTLEDVLARRMRCLFLDARAALEAAPTVAAILATELGRDQTWQQSQMAAFTTIASAYIYTTAPAEPS